MWTEFRTFAMRGNVIDLATGVIIGAAFNKIVTSLTNDILLPPIGLIVGKMDFSNLFVDLSGQGYQTLAEAKAAAVPTMNYGLFINNVIDFLIMAFVVFLIVRQVNRWKAKPSVSAKDCPYCLNKIPLKATRCGNCTSDLA